MPLSYAQSVGNGSQKNFDVPCEYLSKTHISVKVDGVDVPFTWVDTYRLMTTTAPKAGAIVEVRRVTPREDRLVTFTDGSTLVETDLNTSTLQSFFLAQEAFDQGAASLAVTEDGQYSAQTRRITTVGNPVNPQDAVTKYWAETGMTSQLTLAVAARTLSQQAQAASEAARDAAIQARNDAQQARSDAQGARDSASGHRLNASNAQKGSEDARDISVAKAAEASTDRAASQTARTGSEAARDASQGYRNEAQGFRNEAFDLAQSLNAANLVKKDSNLSDLTDKNAARNTLGAVAKAGDTMTGSLVVRATSGHGAIELVSGDIPGSGRPGYINFFTPNGNRVAYLGWKDASQNRLVLNFENTFDGLNVGGWLRARDVVGDYSVGAPRVEIRAPAGNDAVVDWTSDNRTRDYDWRALSTRGGNEWGLYSWANHEFQVNTNGHVWARGYGWLHEKFSNRGEWNVYATDIWEMGQADFWQGAGGWTWDAWDHYVLTGFAKNSNTQFIRFRCRRLRNA